MCFVELATIVIRSENMLEVMLGVAWVDNPFENSLAFGELAAIVTGSVKTWQGCHSHYGYQFNQTH